MDRDEQGLPRRIARDSYTEDGIAVSYTAEGNAELRRLALMGLDWERRAWPDRVQALEVAVAVLRTAIVGAVESEADQRRGVWHGHRHLDPSLIERQLTSLQADLRRVGRMDHELVDRVREVLGEAWESPEHSLTERLEASTAEARTLTRLLEELSARVQALEARP